MRNILLILSVVWCTFSSAQTLVINVPSNVSSEHSTVDFTVTWGYSPIEGDYQYIATFIEQTVSHTNGAVIERITDTDPGVINYGQVTFSDYANPGNYTYSIRIDYTQVNTVTGQSWPGSMADHENIVCTKTTPTCSSNITITTNYSSGTHSFSASNTITATNTISGSANVSYGANSKVVLSPGFKALSGSTFSADNNGCGTKSASTELSVNTDMSEISMYPNPADQESTISFGKVSGEKQVRVFSSSGILLSQHATEEESYLLDLSDFESGVYLVNITTEHGAENQKLIIK